MHKDTLTGHLTDLRNRLISALIGIFFGCLICWIYSDFLFDLIRGPIEPFLKTDSQGLVYTGVMDKFIAYMKVSLLGGMILTCPYWLYQIWGFIAPGLYVKEKKFGLLFVVIGSLLFLMGVAFVYWVVYPTAFHFLMNFGDSKDIPLIAIDKYLSFFIMTTVVFGLTFELPLIFTFLALMGLLKKNFLIQNRRYGIILLAILSAMVTPPDVISMCLLMGPLILLYELSILLVGAVEK